MDDEPPRGYVRARVTRRIDHAPDLATYWLRPDTPLAFAPGQYVTLALAGRDGATVKRAYSVASAPHEPDLELFVECVPDGALTPCLFDRAEGGTVWMRARTAGRFLLDAERTHHVMAATVTGIAPFLSMLRDRRHAGAAGARAADRFLVLYGASHPAEHGPYADELRTLGAEEDVVAVPTISRPWASPEWGGERGRVEDVLRKHLDTLGWDPAATAGYACGNPTMIQNVLGILRRAGMDEVHLHEEKYYTESGEAIALDDAAPAPRPAGPPGGIVLRSVPRDPSG